jgi:hypothetical protein
MSKNVGSFVLSVMMLGLVLGCNCNLSEWVRQTAQSNSNQAVVVDANKSIVDSVTQTAIGDDKTGIAECDEFLAVLETQLQSPDTDFVTRNLIYYFKQQIATQARTDIANKNPQEKAELAKQCKQMATQLNAQLNNANQN